MTRRLFFLFALLLLIPAHVFATQDSLPKGEDDKKILKLLLKERKDRFSQYTENVDNKSGIFGNQTKKDLKEVNEVLKEIVRTDNKIIMELDRLLDQRKFENFRSEYETKKASQELVTLQQQNEKLIAANDTLQKQLSAVQGTGPGASGSGSSTVYMFLAWFFGAILLFMLLLRWRKGQAPVKRM
jgi:hypothetical protein